MSLGMFCETGQWNIKSLCSTRFNFKVKAISLTTTDIVYNSCTSTFEELSKGRVTQNITQGKIILVMVYAVTSILEYF